MRLLWIWGGVLGVVLYAGGGNAAELRSEYTDLDFAQCTTVEADDTGAMSACPGLRGYPVVIGEGDLRMFVSFGIDAGSRPELPQPGHKSGATIKPAAASTAMPKTSMPTRQPPRTGDGIGGKGGMTID